MNRTTLKDFLVEKSMYSMIWAGTPNKSVESMKLSLTSGWVVMVTPSCFIFDGRTATLLGKNGLREANSIRSMRWTDTYNFEGSTNLTTSLRKLVYNTIPVIRMGRYILVLWRHHGCCRRGHTIVGEQRASEYSPIIRETQQSAGLEPV